MKVLIDADGCPVVEITVNTAKKYDIEVIIISDTSHIIKSNYAKILTAEKGNDSVDFKLVNMVKNNDIVVTQDYGLASMVLAKGGIPINQDGLVYTNENIDSLLLSRHISAKLRRNGKYSKGKPKRTQMQNENFQLSLNKLFKEAVSC